MKNFDFKTALLTLTSAVFLAAAAPAAQPVLIGDGPGVGGPGTDDDTGSDGDMGSGGSYCEHRGVKTVPSKIGMVGPLIACDGTFNLTVGTDALGGTLTWSGVDCPSFIEMIPSHDKPIQKLHHRLTGYTWVPRQQLRFKCDRGYWWWEGDNCIPAGSNFSLPKVQHFYEMPCELNSGAGF